MQQISDVEVSTYNLRIGFEFSKYFVKIHKKLTKLFMEIIKHEEQ